MRNSLDGLNSKLGKSKEKNRDWDIGQKKISRVMRGDAKKMKIKKRGERDTV